MKRQAFTLIELLVVIAIISLLVSILLPSLQVAKTLAKRVMCLSNFHNVFNGLLLYTQDNDNLLPRATNDGASDGLAWSWRDKGVLLPYLGYADDVASNKTPYNGILSCPEEDSRVSYTVSLMVIRPNWSAAFSPPTKLDDFVGTMPVFSEAWSVPAWDDQCSSGIYYTDWEKAYTDNKHWLATRHDGGAAYLFVDGHTEYNVGIPERNFWRYGEPFEAQFYAE